MKEEWKVLDSFPNYKISNTGKIISLKFNKEIGKKSNYNNGYITVTLRGTNENKSLYKHRLVAQLFIPNPNNKPDINHIDGNKWNCSIDNLQWVTKSENTQHAVSNGLLKVRGSDNRQSILTEEDVVYIKKNYKPRIVTMKELADKFNVKTVTIDKIINGYNWKHIEV